MHRPLRIFVVEDDPLIQLQYQIYLTEQGYDVTCAGSLADAKNVLNSNQIMFDLVLLDNQLDDGEGIVLVSQIKHKMIYCAVLVISSNTEHKFLIDAFSNGIDDYIIKPANLELLNLKIKSNAQRLAVQRLADEQSKALQQWKDNAQHEQELANYLLNSMFTNINQVSPAIEAWIQPSEVFSGDAIIQCQSPDGSVYVLLADAMGHGLAAAVSLMPLIQAFKTMANKGLPLANVVFELNKKLLQMLPEGRFVAAALLKIKPRQKSIELWNGGLPAVLLLDKGNNIVQRFSSENMPLGILDDIDFSAHPFVFEYKHENSLLLFTDGLIETPDVNGVFLKDIDVVRVAENNKEKVLSSLVEYISNYFQKPEDDISVCMIDCSKLQECAAGINVQHFSENVSGDVNCSYELTGAAIQTVDVPGLVANLLSVNELPLDLVQRAFTVVTELFVNALEHGVLQLDSELKMTDDGFVKFYSEKEQRLQHLSAKDYIKLDMAWDSINRRLSFVIADSGAGFLTDLPTAATDENIFGRGLGLIKKLTSSFDVIPPGNQFRVVISE